MYRFKCINIVDRDKKHYINKYLSMTIVSSLQPVNTEKDQTNWQGLTPPPSPPQGPAEMRGN